MSGDYQDVAAIEAQKMEGLKALTEYGVDKEKSVLLAQTQADAEKFTYPWNPNRPAYGALPHFGDRDQIIGHFADEAKYFGKHYQPGPDAKKPAWMDASYAEGALMFEMKFGKKLSEFAEEILRQYPDLGKQGKEISIFGLSGSGKSTALESLRDTLGEDVVEMDSDTIRYNLLGKMVRDIETANGATLDQVRNDLLHNNISGALYFAVNHIAKELKARGYTVLRSSTSANEGSDVTMYIEHPSVNPENIGTSGDKEKDSAEVAAVAKELHAVTQSRTHGADSFDWDHAETQLDFRQMKPVTVQVPERVHGIFVTGVRDYLKSHPDVVRVANPTNTDSEAIKRNFARQFESVLK